MVSSLYAFEICLCRNVFMAPKERCATFLVTSPVFYDVISVINVQNFYQNVQ